MSPPFDPSPPASTTLPPPDPTPPTPTTLSPPDPIALQLLRPLTPLQQLRALDRSSPMFHDQLFDFLGEKGFKDCISNLEEPDAIWLVNFLDMVRTPPPRNVHQFPFLKSASSYEDSTATPLEGFLKCNVQFAVPLGCSRNRTSPTTPPQSMIGPLVVSISPLWMVHFLL